MYHCKINHMLLLLLCVLSSSMFLCATVCNLDVESMVSKGVGLQHHQFWSSKSTDVGDCARICVKRKLCQSFNFDTSTRQCELNDDVFSTGMEVRSGETLMYSNIAQWPAQVEPDCFHRPCDFDEICIPGQLLGNTDCSYTCLKMVPTPTRLSTTLLAVPTTAPLTQTPLSKGHEVSTSGSQDTTMPGLTNVATTRAEQTWHKSALAGSRFVTVFPRVATGGNEDAVLRRIYITSNRETRVRIKSSFLSLDRNVSVNTILLQDFPTSFTLTENHTISDKVIEITADFPINVHTLSYKNGTDEIAGDSFYNLPIVHLSKEYILITTNVTPQFCVIGTEDGTNVEISLRKRAVPLNIHINRFEVFTFFLNNDNDDDLTGSIITSDKNVAVISGGYFASIPPSRNITNDMNAMQLPDVSRWSNTCILSPFKPRIGFEYKIVAVENDTYISISTNEKVTNIMVHRAEKHEYLHLSDSPVFVSATKPILVAMFTLGNHRGSNARGDSSMVQCLYLESYANSYTFFVPANFDSFLRIIIRRL